MALIKCSECGKEISSKAAACPYCGCPIEDNNIVAVKIEKATTDEPSLGKIEGQKKKKTIITGILVILILAVAIVLGVKTIHNKRFEGCAYATAMALKEILKNPDSLSVYDAEFYTPTNQASGEERNTITDEKHPIVIMHYTAQNGYGGNTTGYVVATYHKDTKRYEIDGYTYTLNSSEISKYDTDAEWQKVTIWLIRSCRENNEKIGDINIKKLNRKIKNP